jgi:hypothetical protein
MPQILPVSRSNPGVLDSFPAAGPVGILVIIDDFRHCRVPVFAFYIFRLKLSLLNFRLALLADSKGNRLKANLLPMPSTVLVMEQYPPDATPFGALKNTPVFPSCHATLLLS